MRIELIRSHVHGAIRDAGISFKIGWFGDGFDLFSVHGPLMALGFMSIITAMLLLATGVIGEMLMRIYFESTGAKTYRVRQLVGLGKNSGAPQDASDDQDPTTDPTESA